MSIGMRVPRPGRLCSSRTCQWKQVRLAFVGLIPTYMEYILVMELHSFGRGPVISFEYSSLRRTILAVRAAGDPTIFNIAHAIFSESNRLFHQQALQHVRSPTLPTARCNYSHFPGSSGTGGLIHRYENENATVRAIPLISSGDPSYSQVSQIGHSAPLLRHRSSDLVVVKVPERGKSQESKTSCVEYLLHQPEALCHRL